MYHFHGMANTVKMDKAGRVVIPRMVRERFGLTDGSYDLELSESAEGIVLRPVAEEIPMERHVSGWVVFHSSDEEAVDPNRTIDEERERRHRQIRGDG